MEEKKQIVHFLESERGVTIADMRTFLAERFRVYELISTSLGVPAKPRLPHSRTPANITAGAAITEEEKEKEGLGRERPAKRGRGPRGGGRGGHAGLPHHGAGQEDGGKPKPSTPTCNYCVAKKRPPNPHSASSCPWFSAASHSDLVATLPNLCLGCLRQKNAARIISIT